MHDDEPPAIEPLDESLLVPDSLNAGDGDWWWQYGLDGLVGGVIGGLATGVAVWLTIRHERKLVERMALKEAVSSLQAAAYQAALILPLDDEFASWHKWLVDLQTEVLRVAALATTASPGLRRRLRSFWNFLVRETTGKDEFTPDRQRLIRVTTALSAELADWQGQKPGRFSAESYKRWSVIANDG